MRSPGRRRHEAEEAPTPELAAMHRREAEMDATAACLHEEAEQVQRHHATEHADEAAEHDETEAPT